MQIVEKSGEGLSRVYGVSVSAKELGQKLDARIAEIAPQLNLKGFRPGKVPAAHVRRIYGRSLMGEVVEQTLSETSQKVLEDNQLRVASQPDLKPESDMEKVLAGQADARLDHTDDGQRGMMRAQGIERGRRRRVAGNHQTANAPPDQCGRALQGIAHDGFGALGAVRKPCGIAEVNEILGGHGRTQRPQYRQAADARVEHADRVQDSGRMCGNSRTSRIDGEFVYSMTSRSTPNPSPAVGGMPYSSART